MPGGIAEQIVRARVPVYRDMYDATKARLTETRAGDIREIESSSGAQEGPEVERIAAIEGATGLRPFQIDAIARKVAAKGFVADLLADWKRLLPVAVKAEIDATRGREQEGASA
jgi:hypothetical protein